MIKLPKDDKISTCLLQVVLMPNGEVICKGKTIGWFYDLKEFLIDFEFKKND